MNGMEWYNAMPWDAKRFEFEWIGIDPSKRSSIGPLQTRYSESCNRNNRNKNEVLFSICSAKRSDEG